MYRTVSLCILFVFFIATAFGQNFWLNLPRSSYEVAPDAGVETALELGFTQAHTAAVRLSATAPSGIRAIFQPATVSKSQRVILSLLADTTVKGQVIPVSINATDGISSVTKDISLKVIDDAAGSHPAVAYRDSALTFLVRQHPDFVPEFGDLRNLEWQGYWPWPMVLVVSHYIFLSGNWRIVVLWHVMIPPDNWKRVYVGNDSIGVYWGMSIDTNGDYKEIPFRQVFHFGQDVTSGEKPHTRVPDSHGLSQNYPNPFNPKTVISFELPVMSRVSLKVYDMLGRDVAALVDEEKPAGAYVVTFDASRLSSGVYFYRLVANAIPSGQARRTSGEQAGVFAETRKLVVLK